MDYLLSSLGRMGGLLKVPLLVAVVGQLLFELSDQRHELFPHHMRCITLYEVFDRYQIAYLRLMHVDSKWLPVLALLHAFVPLPSSAFWAYVWKSNAETILNKLSFNLSMVFGGDSLPSWRALPAFAGLVLSRLSAHSWAIS